MNKPFSCLTIFREPISRLISCLFFRFPYYSANGYQSINDFQVDELNELLKMGKDEYGDNCINEPFKILSGFNNNEILLDLDVESFTKHALLNITLSNCNKCVIIISNDPKYNDYLQYMFPQLANAFKHEESLLYGHYQHNITHFRPEILELLNKFTELESILYHAVFTKYNNRIKRIQNLANNLN